MERERGGLVWIAPEVGWDFPTDRLFDPEHSLFWARWEVYEDDRMVHDEDEAIVGAEAAIQWGHERADLIYIRLSDSDHPFYSAGRVVRTHDFDGVPMQQWPPNPPPEGWWRPSEAFIRERLRQWQSAHENTED